MKNAGRCCVTVSYLYLCGTMTAAAASRCRRHSWAGAGYDGERAESPGGILGSRHCRGSHMGTHEARPVTGGVIGRPPPAPLCCRLGLKAGLSAPRRPLSPGVCIGGGPITTPVEDLWFHGECVALLHRRGPALYLWHCGCCFFDASKQVWGRGVQGAQPYASSWQSRTPC